MERKGQERDLEIPNFQESPLKLPLAPILSAPSDRKPNPAAGAASGRRGSSIFSPVQTLDPPENPNPRQLHLSPSPPQHLLAQREPTPDSPPPLAAADADAGADSNSSVRYRECLKNHAARMGGHVVDGCGEFMPGGDVGTPESLRCAACDCHRSFHRKEIDGEQPHHFSHQRGAFLHGGQATYSLPPPPHHRRRHKGGTPTAAVAAPSVMFNFGVGGPAAESSSDDLNMFRHQTVSPPSHSRKRFRTKFSQDQKDRMLEFASRIGWRIQKHDEEDVQRFCNDVGVKRQVFKVWMHNNKQASRRRQQQDQRSLT
ncbi:zinc-finger homeodomain protein 6 [Andrographis paniculata]|uniref:zinc-finger homeodomain protein 6 n=1 Tax=Andrographis paniculata TaxID=175694 RepID=UPI0021E91649|nr:zinc-finger homeodomain protein 6 [Andrographis paniculata]